MSRRLALALLVMTVAACARTRVETTIRPDLIGTKYARITGYMATRGAAPGGRHTEQTPGDIPHDVLRDEATLVKADGREVCVATVVRTASVHDEPLEQLSPTFEIDGQSYRAVVEDEVVFVYDHTYAGKIDVLDVQGVTASSYLGMTISQPAEKVFRVVERHGTLCAPATGHTIALDLTHPYWDVASYKYHLVFEWKLRG
jgi:hypothetical protein